MMLSLLENAAIDLVYAGVINVNISTKPLSQEERDQKTKIMA